MKNHGVNSLCFIYDRKTIDVKVHGKIWAKLKRLYINGVISDPQILFRKEEFLFKYCNSYYFLGYINTDSVVYEFSPVNRYYEYDYSLKVLRKTQFRSHKYLHGLYKNKLPKCKENKNNTKPYLIKRSYE